MSDSFRGFLQGLLTKDTSRRLSWPELAQHEFVRDGVKSTNPSIKETNELIFFFF